MDARSAALGAFVSPLVGVGKVPPKNHRAPHSDCHCGFYAVRRLNDVKLQFGPAGQLGGLDSYPDIRALRTLPVPGAVAVWGDLCVHRHGFRASHACVVALAVLPSMPPVVRDLLRGVAESYRVALVDIGDLEAEASRHGTPLPDTCSPPPQLNTSFAEAMREMQAAMLAMQRPAVSARSARRFISAP